MERRAGYFRDKTVEARETQQCVERGRLTTGPRDGELAMPRRLGESNSYFEFEIHRLQEQRGTSVVCA